MLPPAKEFFVDDAMGPVVGIFMLLVDDFFSEFEVPFVLLDSFVCSSVSGTSYLPCPFSDVLTFLVYGDFEESALGRVISSRFFVRLFDA